MATRYSYWHQGRSLEVLVLGCAHVGGVGSSAVGGVGGERTTVRGPRLCRTTRFPPSSGAPLSQRCLVRWATWGLGQGCNDLASPPKPLLTGTRRSGRSMGENDLGWGTAGALAETLPPTALSAFTCCRVVGGWDVRAMRVVNINLNISY